MSSYSYIEGNNVYENKNGVIYKNGTTVGNENYKYIPKEIGGTRQSEGKGDYITNNTTSKNDSYVSSYTPPASSTSSTTPSTTSTNNVGNSKSNIYIEGNNIYENRNGEVYKNGKIVSTEDLKYIPKEIGGTRNTSGNGHSLSTSDLQSIKKVYTEGNNVYENVQGKIYKNGSLVEQENMRYIPKEIGGTRQSEGKGQFVYLLHN